MSLHGKTSSIKEFALLLTKFFIAVDFHYFINSCVIHFHLYKLSLNNHSTPRPSKANLIFLKKIGSLSKFQFNQMHLLKYFAQTFLIDPKIIASRSNNHIYTPQQQWLGAPWWRRRPRLKKREVDRAWERRRSGEVGSGASTETMSTSAAKTGRYIKGRAPEASRI